MTPEQFLEEKTLSYWESHQFENALHEEGEYLKIDDAIEYAEIYHKSKVENLSSNTVLANRLPNAEDVKRWYQLLVGKNEIEMQKDIEATLR